MIKITPEELVRYLYQETSDKKTAAIRKALEDQRFPEIESCEQDPGIWVEKAGAGSFTLN